MTDCKRRRPHCGSTGTSMARTATCPSGSAWTGPSICAWTAMKAHCRRRTRSQRSHPVSGGTRGSKVSRCGAPVAGRSPRYCGVPPECILTTNGSDQAIDLCLRAFLGEDNRLLVARPEFSIFSHVAALIGAQVQGVPFYEDLSFPYTEFREAAASGNQTSSSSLIRTTLPARPSRMISFWISHPVTPTCQ